jgi:non-reducing end alpha-L-arabinofuranosidase
VSKTHFVLRAVELSLPWLLGFATVGCWDYTAAPEAEAGRGGTTGTSGSGGTGTGGTSSAGTTSGGTGSGGGPAMTLPCDILEGASLPCVSAHSTVRLLVRGYAGPLYQVQRGDSAVQDIGATAEGYADVVAQDAFCSAKDCLITIIYDQSPYGHHLTPAPPGSNNPSPGRPAPIGNLPVTLNGRSAYGILFRPGRGYRAACNACPYPTGPMMTATGDAPQTMYMVSSQHDLIDGCCFDYGNAEYTRNNDGNGTMEAVFLGRGVIWGSGVGPGPWVMADLENGLYAGWENDQWDNISTNTSLTYDYITAVVVGDTSDKNNGMGRFALYGGDATTGGVTKMYDGIRPTTPGYVPMKKQGSVILSIGGDNTDGDGGRFYEGVMANGAASQETVDALQASIVAAGYGK